MILKILGVLRVFCFEILSFIFFSSILDISNLLNRIPAHDVLELQNFYASFEHPFILAVRQKVQLLHPDPILSVGGVFALT